MSESGNPYNGSLIGETFLHAVSQEMTGKNNKSTMNFIGQIEDVVIGQDEKMNLSQLEKYPNISNSEYLQLGNNCTIKNVEFSQDISNNDMDRGIISIKSENNTFVVIHTDFETKIRYYSFNYLNINDSSKYPWISDTNLIKKMENNVKIKDYEFLTAKGRDDHAEKMMINLIWKEKYGQYDLHETTSLPFIGGNKSLLLIAVSKYLENNEYKYEYEYFYVEDNLYYICTFDTNNNQWIVKDYAITNEATQVSVIQIGNNNKQVQSIYIPEEAPNLNNEEVVQFNLQIHCNRNSESKLVALLKNESIRNIYNTGSNRYKYSVSPYTPQIKFHTSVRNNNKYKINEDQKLELYIMDDTGNNTTI